MFALDSEINGLQSIRKFFIISFVVWAVSLVSVYSFIEDDIFGIVMAVLLVSGLSYTIILGLLASKTNSSVIIWVGLNMILAPLSFPITFFMMLNKVNKKLAELISVRNSYE